MPRKTITIRRIAQGTWVERTTVDVPDDFDGDLDTQVHPYADFDEMERSAHDCTDAQPWEVEE